MRTLLISSLFLLAGRLCFAQGAMEAPHTDSLAKHIYGQFMDDYGIQYTITDSTWKQSPGGPYHIIRHNETEHFLVVRNDAANKTDPGRFTRIDYMAFDGMEPYRWGFCLTSYNASTDSLAEAALPADRKNPRKGCGGFPFSRMKRII